MRKGFTLIELILVVAIIAILAGAMVPMIAGARVEAREARAMAEVDAIRSACHLYESDTGAWPAAMADLAAAPVPAVAGWDGPYIDQVGNDPWGRAYAFNGAGPVWIQSQGNDGDSDGCPNAPATPGADGDICVMLHQ